MSFVTISYARLSVALAFIAIAVLVSRRLRLGLERDLVIGAVRAAGQLIGVGYLLLLLFRHEAPLWVFVGLTFMLVTAAVTSTRRVSHGPPLGKLAPAALASIALASTVALVPTMLLIVPPEPWSAARYWIPLGGMVLWGAMDMVAQVFERVFSLAHSDAAAIEQLLALGASPAQALEPAARTAIRAAMIPAINRLVAVGLVSLPGMMTGQIVSGVLPEQAVRYQIVILYQLTAVSLVAGATATLFARRLLFTRRAQLIDYGQD